MIHAPVWLSDALFALAGASLLYTGFALARVLAFRLPGAAEEPAMLPTMTVLKPLDGLEPELEENLWSFCNQEYPRYQVVCCAKDAADPALAVARSVGERAAGCDVLIASGGTTDVENPKIANLLAAMPLVSGEIVVIADSDMRVERDYLRRIAAAFSDARAGAATTLYGARSTTYLAARLGALFVNDQFVPSVLVATALQPLRFCFGATMAVRRDALERIGGLRALGATIADDYELGARISAAGRRVALAGTVPLTFVSETSLLALLAREIRWARTIRAVRPLGYAGTIVAFPMTLAFLALLFAPSPVAGAVVFAIALAMRLGIHLVAHRVLRIPGPPRPLLVPLREAVSVAVWGAGLFGSAVRWRQGNYSIRAKGR